VSKDKVNWEYINEWKKDVNPLGKKEDFKMTVIPFGLPEVLDPYGTKYGIDVEVLPRWDIPPKVLVCQTITGSFLSKRANPNQPIDPDAIREQALACLAAGAPNVHIHVRDENGYNVLDPELFHYVIDPIRKEYPDRMVCGCMIPVSDGDWPKMVEVLQDGLLDQTPINTTATYVGDITMVKPPHVMIEKTRIVQELGVKAQLAIYSDGDIDNAHRYLIRTGLLEKPYYWVILPGMPGCSPMHNPKAMVEVLMHYCNRIKEIDEDSHIVVCATGRASSYLTTLALLLGHSVRVGMEDTVWRWPHRNDLIKHNLEIFQTTKQLVELLGRQIATAEEWRTMLKMKKPVVKPKTEEIQ
jgi:3-keto-5-aminohexanoate cleavage enzyme